MSCYLVNLILENHHQIVQFASSLTHRLTLVPLSLWILLDIPGMGTDFLVLEVLVAGTNGLLVGTPEDDICL